MVVKNLVGTTLVGNALVGNLVGTSLVGGGLVVTDKANELQGSGGPKQS